VDAEQFGRCDDRQQYLSVKLRSQGRLSQRAPRGLLVRRAPCTVEVPRNLVGAECAVDKAPDAARQGEIEDAERAQRRRDVHLGAPPP
jgi:hypothetical protein